MNNDELLIAIKDMFEKKIDEVKSELRSEVNKVKYHTEILSEKLQSDIKTIAEGHSDLNKKIDKLQNDMTTVKDYIVAVDTKLNEHEVILKRAK